ncbi:MAG: hypothetical protein K2Y29_16615 [Beijerinckiaceae bacterium]|nr:hypothetical protein [Beijerinckiaceae bacterium]
MKTYLIPASGFVGVNYGMELLEPWWVHLDYVDYGDGSFSDEEVAKAERDRDPAKVVTRAAFELRYAACSMTTKGRKADVAERAVEGQEWVMIGPITERQFVRS